MTTPVTVTGVSPKSAALMKAWITRRANAAAAKKNAPTETEMPVATTTPAVTVVAATPAPTPVKPAKPTKVSAAAPKADVAPKKGKAARKGLTLCLCGQCDHMVTGDFGQGHDARMKSTVAAIVKGEKPISALRTDQIAALPRLKFVLKLYPQILKMLPKGVHAVA